MTAKEGTGTREGGTGTREVVDRLYAAFLAGDSEGMLATMDDRVAVRFLAHADLEGVDEARRYFAFARQLLRDVSFHVEHEIVDGEWAAVLWHETATTATGEPWANHGVDVICVRDGKVCVLHENNDVRLVARHFPKYDPGPAAS